jgi:hypothetical protein
MAGIKGRSGGTNRKSRLQHEAAGTFRPDRHGHLAHVDPPLGEPVKPAYLGELASAKWDEITGHLRQEKRLYVTDGHQIENAANLYGEAARWQQMADTTPLVSEAGRVNECHVQARLGWDCFRKSIVELALTQTSRSRAAPPRTEASGEAASPLAQLMARAQIQRVK